ncbi:kyphoscoliosis peptidase-like [Mercenaria mercenaria]|uniref:kyphoscoliosis peptidase-like n=1 Tax=Mercenaria mercenaria TaxID=6596 RepID=UPI00234F62D4|nr:kyphoscoliosis peptidase-like [Mercenaria mercenaria]XP_053404592.1 kyphoscoliosis peptidase-like [Mercenaria mercenaria]
MGCPQSKSKSKDVSSATENGANSHVAKTRNDTVQPATESPKRMPTKTPHEYNDDPLVRGRTDDSFPAHIPPDVHKFERDTINNKQGAVKEIGSEHNSGNHKTNETKESADNAQNEVLASETKTSDNIKTKNTDNISAKDETEHGFKGVFIPDEIPDAQSKEVKPLENGYKEDIVDVSDVDIGQTVSEITLENQTVEEANKYDSLGTTSETKIEGQSGGSVKVELDTEDGYTFTEMPHKWEGSSAVRYVSKEKIEYGLPEGVPKPAPPKTRKSDIVKPTTFTMVDKIVDNAPDNAFNSVTKLASYLSGTAKKSELAAAGDDKDDTESENLPPPLPVKTKKSDIVSDPTMFKHVDENARNVPESVRLSVDKLAAHLCSVAKSDLEKVRAYYYWVCNNISYVYDKDKTLSDRLRFDAVSTLRQGQGSFVNLMVALCKEASIPVVTVSGCSKGLRHQPDKEFTVAETNHSWNAVHINGEWRFLDCTWGSGYLDHTGKFRRQFDEFWFLTDPEVFAYDHFPMHQKWQLLDDPISIDEFNKKPSLTEKSKELGFQLKSHREPIVYFENEVSISFATETFPLSNITADLKNEDSEEINQYRCMKRLDDKLFEIRVVPPNIGEYSLALYGKAKDYRHAKFRKLMEYTLRCEKAYDNEVVFPDHRKAWGPEPNYNELGFADSIQNMSVFKSDEKEMTIQLDQKKKVPIIAELKASSDIKTELKGYTMITARDDAKIVHIRFPSAGYYRLDVYAEGKLEKYEYAALFLLECTESNSPKKFPKCNEDSISKNVCEILEPTNFEVPSNSNITFRIRSHCLKNVMVGIPTEDQRMQRLGELKKSGDIFSGDIKTPKAGEVLYLSGSAAPPNVFWSRIYEFITV